MAPTGTARRQGRADMRCHGSKSIVRTFFPVMLAFLLVFLIPWTAGAHPLGNFSVNHYSHLRVEGGAIVVLYIIDMAEIPTFQEMPDLDADRDGRVSLDERRAYLARKSEELKSGLMLKVSGRSLPLEAIATDLLFSPGAGGLPTMKIGARYKAEVRGAGLEAINDLAYHDTNFTGRPGWKEIVASETGTVFLVASSVPSSDRSNQLSVYPADFINSPPQEIEAHLRFSARDVRSIAASRPVRRERSETDLTSPLEASRRLLAQEVLDGATVQAPVIGGQALPEGSEDGERRAQGRAGEREVIVTSTGPVPEFLGTPDVSPTAPEQFSAGMATARAATTPRSRFTELITTEELSAGIVLFSLMVAFALGAFHALEPGHGKTVVAAYLVGSRGTARHAMLLGGIVTASHTFGVYLLGVVTLYMSRYIVPERLYPWLGFVSGLTILGMGCLLFIKYLRRGHQLPHGHGEVHLQGSLHHPHGEDKLHFHHHLEDPDHSHDHGGHHHHHSQPEIRREGGEVSYRELFALGITGGIIPCPAALVVLLSAISLNRVGFGLVLIVAFSVGLAVVLMGIGLLMVYARGIMATWSGEGRLLQRLPLVSSVVIAILGFAIALQALVSGGVLQLRL